MVKPVDSKTNLSHRNKRQVIAYFLPLSFAITRTALKIAYLPVLSIHFNLDITVPLQTLFLLCQDNLIFYSFLFSYIKAYV